MSTLTYPWKAIAAMSLNRVIGNQGKIPWHLPEDFKWVKSCTTGKAIVMGRKTFESMGRPLPNRDNIVVSRSLQNLDGCIVIDSLDAVDRLRLDKEIWIFGGAEIYRQAMDKVGELYLTIVQREVEGDAFFPAFETQFSHCEKIRETAEFKIFKYSR